MVQQQYNIATANKTQKQGFKSKSSCFPFTFPFLTLVIQKGRKEKNGLLFACNQTLIGCFCGFNRNLWKCALE